MVDLGWGDRMRHIAAGRVGRGVKVRNNRVLESLGFPRGPSPIMLNGNHHDLSKGYPKN